MARDMLTHGILYKDESHHVDDDEDTKNRLEILKGLDVGNASLYGERKGEEVMYNQTQDAFSGHIVSSMN